MECSHIPFGFPIGFGSQAAIKARIEKKLTIPKIALFIEISHYFH